MQQFILLILKRGLKVGLLTGFAATLTAIIDPQILSTLPPDLYLMISLILPFLTGVISMLEKAITEKLKTTQSKGTRANEERITQ